MLRRIRGNKERGFTLIELMIVIAVIGILAAIAIPRFIMYRQKGYDAKANSDLKNAYIAAQGYFTTFPNGTISLTDLTDHGYVQSSDVVLNVPTGTRTNLQMTASHTSGSRTYTVNDTGTISF